MKPQNIIFTIYEMLKNLFYCGTTNFKQGLVDNDREEVIKYFLDPSSSLLALLNAPHTQTHK